MIFLGGNIASLWYFLFFTSSPTLSPANASLTPPMAWPSRSMIMDHPGPARPLEPISTLNSPLTRKSSHPSPSSFLARLDVIRRLLLVLLSDPIYSTWTAGAREWVVILATNIGKWLTKADQPWTSPVEQVVLVEVSRTSWTENILAPALFIRTPFYFAIPGRSDFSSLNLTFGLPFHLELIQHHPNSAKVGWTTPNPTDMLTGSNSHMESFRTESIAFKSLPWRTDILHTPGGYEQLTDISQLSVRQWFFVWL